MSMTDESLAYKPFHYPWAVEFAKEHELAVWFEHEMNLQSDVDQWRMNKLSPAKKEQITHIQRLFTETDRRVAGNYLDHYIPMFKNNEIRAALASIAAREFTHQRAYALMNDTMGWEDSEYSSYLDSKTMRDKIEFMQSVDTKTMTGRGLGIVQTVINEGVGLFSSFAMLINYQLHGEMMGMCSGIEWSARDETMHCDFMIRVFREHCKEHPKIVTDEFKKDIFDMFRREVKLEDKVIDDAYPDGEEINGVGPADVKQYIRYLADRRLIQLGLKSNWHVRENPLSHLEALLHGDSFKNFFEAVVTDYSSEGLIGEFW